MFSYDKFFSEKIVQLQAEHRYRYFRNIGRKKGEFPVASYSSKEISVWCTNDYLGMGQHPDVVEAMHQALDRYGSGSGGTRNISGTHHEIVELEDELAKLFGKGSALLFSSGYIANETALSVLGRLLPNCVFFSDSENHASIIEGMRASGARKVIFEHNSVEDLESKLQSYPVEQAKVVVFESVYSMSGELSPFKEIITIAKKYGALLYIDETHSVGVYGNQGAGILEQEGLLDQIDIIQGGLGKGYGVVGGFIAGNATLVDVIRSYGSGFIFTTSLPPVVVAGALASVRHLKYSNKERKKVFENIALLKKEFRKRQVEFIDHPSHLIPVMINNAELCNYLAEVLLNDYGMYLQPINYPTVPRGTERFRICPTAAHSSSQCIALASALEELLAKQSFAKPQSKLKVLDFTSSVQAA